ncbi:hypothetical protein Vspart_03630 [Vibrio spartinae]|uniref:Transposase n=1 Tax=Vibrio spartinae TaxID=1918945 RepID=A0ABX6R5Q2_9VIBR|nr:hypothetical protein Vspart_03630 [Vibrio spartinae]
MKCYNNSHPYYCGIDLHARLLYICILDSQANIIVHKKIAARQNSERNIEDGHIHPRCQDVHMMKHPDTIDVRVVLTTPIGLLDPLRVFIRSK